MVFHQWPATQSKRPAIVGLNGYKSHCINGKLHNPDGPAVVWPSGYKNYFINGEELTEADFKAWQTEQTAK